MPESEEHLDQLRKEMESQQIDAFLLPLADVHLGEAIAERDQRLKFMTGFTGSGGFLVVCPQEARLFVDGRYTIQAKDQCEGGPFSLGALGPEDPISWAIEQLEPGARLGFDPQIHSVRTYERMQKLAKAAAIKLCPLKQNPVDKIWRERPAKACGAIFEHPLDYAGVSREDKIAKVRKALEEKGCSVLLLNRLESIAWLFNLRGRDLPETPVTQGYALIDQESARLFVDERKVGSKLRDKLEGVISIETPEQWPKTLETLSATNAKVLFDPQEGNAEVYLALTSGTCQVVLDDDPILAMQAIKHEAEIAGSRAAHIRDGQALCRFLHWLEGALAAGKLTEGEAAARLGEFRAEDDLFFDVSFSTISAFGANAALPHYRFPEDGGVTLEEGSLYLVDSGGQYRDGTTDVTRTLVIGAPTAEQKRHYTLVLKGMIALTRARFPQQVAGHQLDTFARQFLWQAGLDYNHGTGHGVGAFLGVHESPNDISRRPSVPILPGMIQSNEPGLYFEGLYGIRIENLILAVALAEGAGDARCESQLVGFETLTFVPLETKLIDKDLLSKEEIAWINAYHAEVRQKLTPGLDPAVADWLTQATESV